MVKRRVWVGVVVVVIASVLPFTGTSTVQANGVLVAQDGSPISKALVVFIPIMENGPEANSHQWEMRVGSDGRFSFTVPVGCYDAFVTAVSFDPQAQRVCLDYRTNDVLRLKMKPPRQVFFYLE